MMTTKQTQARGEQHLHRYKVSILFQFLIFSLLILISAGEAFAANPSPRSRQLNVGVISYGSGDLWSDDALRNWVANRYNGVIGTGNRSDILAMKSINPNMKVLAYDLFCRPASETTAVKNWASARGINFDSMIVRIKPTATPVVARASDVDGTAFSWWRTTNPGNILVHSGFTDAQTRFAWDYRNKNVGAYLAYVMKNLASGLAADGIMMDEEGIIGVTGNNANGLFPLMAPFKENGLDYWQSGSVSSWQRPWASTMTHTQIRDSLRSLRKGWMKTLGDSLRASNLLLIPNWASSGGPYTSTANWDNEARTTVVQYTKGYLLGEYCFINPSGDGQELFCDNAAHACASVADSGVEMWVWPIRVGQFDSSAADGFTIARSRMNALGFMLDCLNPGSTYRFCPHPQINVYFQKSRTLNGITLSDTTTSWDEAWGKYFGVPQKARDESTRGTDPAGQTFTIHKVSLLNPNISGKVQTLAVGRYARGADRRIATTSVNVGLGGTYYELLTGGKFSTTPVTSTSIANAQWRIFVSDTTIANGGSGSSGAVSCTGSTQICSGATGNLNCLDDTSVDIVDLVLLVDYLFLSFKQPCCPKEANVDASPDGSIDLADLTTLVNHLFGTGTPLPTCPAN